VDNTPQYPSVIATLVGANAGAITLATHLYNLEHQGSQPAKPTILRFSVLHANMYLNSFNLTSHLTGMTKATRGKNILDGAAPFYRIYRTLDHYITIGNIEAKFYAEMIAAMKFPEQRSEYLLENQMNEEEWPKMKEILQEEFSKKTTEEWIGIFSKYDTCVSKVEQLPEPKLNEPWPRLSRHNKEPRSKL
jgi:alpha-methylacyl-CoA racemase